MIRFRSLRRPSARIALPALTLGAIAAGCGTPPPTGIVVEVHSDLDVPRELDRLRFRISSGGASVFEQTHELGSGPGRHALPARLGLEPNGSGSGALTIDVEGVLGAETVVAERVVLPFAHSRVLLLRVDLLRECSGVACPEGLTCAAGQVCHDPTVDPGLLPKYDRDGGPSGGDAGTDGDASDGPPPGTWTDLTPTTRPPSWPEARYDVGLAYDPARGKVVLFGGSNGSRGFRDLWEWDGPTATWSSRTPEPLPAAWPPETTSPGFVYDPARARMVLMGGVGNGMDVWEWDGATGTWSDRTPDPVPAAWPEDRAWHAVAYDQARARL